MSVSFGDRRIDDLVDLYADNADEIALLMTQMAEAEGEDRRKLYLMILALLRNLQVTTELQATSLIQDVYTESQQEAESFMRNAGVEPMPIRREYVAAEIARLSEGMLQDTAKALDAVHGVAARIRTGRLDTSIFTASILVALASGGGKAIEARQRVRQLLRTNMVEILAKNGKVYRYGMDYYIGTVLQHARYAAQTAAVVAQTVAAGMDLIQVSPNPSTIGDYCDMYRGKVFSISGTHPVYPSIRETPGGAGPPFHPNCHHIALPFVEGVGQDFGRVSPEFVELSKQPGMGSNDFQRLWNSKVW